MMLLIIVLFFLLEQKESKIQERSYRPLQGRALPRRLSYHAQHLIMVICTDMFHSILFKSH